MSERFTVGLVEWAGRHRYVSVFLFPTLAAAVLLGAFAALGSWWLWPVVVLLAGPALVIVFTGTESAPVRNPAGAHLGHAR